VSGGEGALRPQAFGRRSVKDVRDPLIEPNWEGDRVIVEVAGDGVRATDVEGAPVTFDDELAAAVAGQVRAGRVVLDAHLTPMAGRTSEGAVVGDVPAPSSLEVAGQLFLGRARSRRSELADSVSEAADDVPLVLVVVDLLEVDADSLLDVPLLERKRILESVLGEGPRVRVGTYVRPPVDPWLGTWRALGFRSVAYKSANGRYRPGEPNDGWALAVIPRR